MNRDNVNDGQAGGQGLERQIPRGGYSGTSEPLTPEPAFQTISSCRA